MCLGACVLVCACACACVLVKARHLAAFPQHTFVTLNTAGNVHAHVRVRNTYKHTNTNTHTHSQPNTHRHTQTNTEQQHEQQHQIECISFPELSAAIRLLFCCFTAAILILLDIRDLAGTGSQTPMSLSSERGCRFAAGRSSVRAFK